MARLLYTAITSLDGYIEDRNGTFDWSVPDEEVHAFINGLERGATTHLYGRRLYETLAAWEHPERFDDPTPVELEYAEIWQAADKIVYSRTLAEVTTGRTRLERDFSAEAVRGLKESAPADLAIGGAELAAHAIRAGLVDECRLFVSPIVVGGGKPALPDDLTVAWELELVDERRFANGVVYLRYATR